MLWVGRKLDELVQWLKAKPEEIDVNCHHFAVLDKGATDNPPTVVVCRIGDLELKGDKLFLLRFERIRAVEHPLGAPSDAWDELTRCGRSAEVDYGDNDA